MSSNSTDAVPSEKSIYDASAVARGVVDGDARLCSLLGRKKTDLSVALFLPFRCNKCRPTDAKRDTKRKRRITRFHRVRRADQQGNPTGGKGRLTTFFPPVNRRVAGSSPARGATPVRPIESISCCDVCFFNVLSCFVSAFCGDQSRTGRCPQLSAAANVSLERLNARKPVTQRSRAIVRITSVEDCFDSGG